MNTATQVDASPGSAPAIEQQMTFAETVAAHWPEYAIEAALIGIFMGSACTFGVIFEHPASPVRVVFQSAFLRRIAMGLSMGLTAIALIYSPIGKRSGAHFNPAVSLTFFRLGKIAGRDAAMYLVAQLIGAVMGTAFASLCLHSAVAHPAVRYVVTVPGANGSAVAFVAELAISFVLMSTVLYFVANSSVARFTGIAAGTLVAAFITFEAPISGMSMNFARTLGSAVNAHIYAALWVYLAAPMLGMLLAAELHVRWNTRTAHHCAKLHHDNDQRCIFCGANGGFRHA